MSRPVSVTCCWRGDEAEEESLKEEKVKDEQEKAEKLEEEEEVG